MQSVGKAKLRAPPISRLSRAASSPLASRLSLPPSRPFPKKARALEPLAPRAGQTYTQTAGSHPFVARTTSAWVWTDGDNILVICRICERKYAKWIDSWLILCDYVYLCVTRVPPARRAISISFGLYGPNPFSVTGAHYGSDEII